jgi:hypothetical protein
MLDPQDRQAIVEAITAGFNTVRTGSGQPQRTPSSGSNTGPFSASGGRAAGEAVGAAATDFSKLALK